MVGLVVVAACGGRGGVEVDVHVKATGAKTVELWLSTSECRTPDGQKACTSGVTWRANMPAVEPDRVFTIDNTELFTSSVDATGTGVFTLTADVPTTLVRVAAIGYDDAMKPVGYAVVVDNADVPAHRSEFWSIDLMPTSDIEDTATTLDGSPHVHVWRPTAVPPDRPDLQPAQLAACLAIETMTNDGPYYEFMLPPDDHDCDDHFDSDSLECKRFQFDYDSSGVDGDCATTMGMPSGACVLGRSGCTDGSKAFGCAQGSEVRCTIDPICAACGGPNLDTTCIDSLLSSATNPQQLDPTLPGGIECMFPSQSYHQCQLSNPYCTLELNIGASGRSCTELKFYDEAPPFSNPRSNLVIDQISFSVQPDSAAPCRYYLTWADGVMWGPTEHVRGLLDFRLDNNNHILVPYQIGFDPTGGTCPSGSANIATYSTTPTLGMATQCE
jgi:hypothetical protein